MKPNELGKFIAQALLTEIDSHQVPVGRIDVDASLEVGEMDLDRAANAIRRHLQQKTKNRIGEVPITLEIAAKKEMCVHVELLIIVGALQALIMNYTSYRTNLLALCKDIQKARITLGKFFRRGQIRVTKVVATPRDQSEIMSDAKEIAATALSEAKKAISVGEALLVLDEGRSRTAANEDYKAQALEIAQSRQEGREALEE